AFCSLTYRNASAPAPPDLFTARNGTGARFSFWMMAVTKRAIRSAPPPVPAGMMNSTGFVGCQPALAGSARARLATPRRMKELAFQRWCLMVPPLTAVLGDEQRSVSATMVALEAHSGVRGQVGPGGTCRAVGSLRSAADPLLPACGRGSRRAPGTS